MTTKSEIIYESKTKHLRYLFDEQGNALPIYNDILDKFTTDEKAYYAGMIDGDGSIQYFKRKDRPGKKLTIVLELKEVNAEPLTELANIFDLSVEFILCLPITMSFTNGWLRNSSTNLIKAFLGLS